VLEKGLRTTVLDTATIKFVDESRTVLFNLFVNAEPLMYFWVCHGTPLKKFRNYELLGQKIKYFVITLLRFKK